VLLQSHWAQSGPVILPPLAAYGPAQTNNLAGTLLVTGVHTAIGAATMASEEANIAASFLHGADQDIVGDLGSVAPPVVGEVDASSVPDIELRL
jgi:hypothetical protein